MRTIIIEKGQEVQPQQYKWKKDIEKVITHIRIYKEQSE